MLQAVYFYDKPIKCGSIRTQSVLVELEEEGLGVSKGSFVYSFHAPHCRSIASRWAGPALPTRAETRDFIKDKRQ